MAVLNLGAAFATAVLAAAGLDPAAHDPATLSIDMVPDDGQATIRVTRTTTVPTTILRKLIGNSAMPLVVDAPTAAEIAQAAV